MKNKKKIKAILLIVTMVVVMFNACSIVSEEKIDETTDASVEIAQQLDESGDENVKEQDDYSQEDNSGITEKEPQENNQEINHEFIQGDDVKVPAITEEESTNDIKTETPTNGTVSLVGLHIEEVYETDISGNEYLVETILYYYDANGNKCIVKNYDLNGDGVPDVTWDGSLTLEQVKEIFGEEAYIDEEGNIVKHI